MILLIDNYDSFVYNLYQMVGSLHPDLKVIRNDEYTIEEVIACNPQRIILSPGPGRPKDAGICQELIQRLAPTVPILGVCLGHQAICEAYGATITYAKTLMHGKQSTIAIDQSSPLFQGLQAEIPVARYHSLAADESTLSKQLQVIARSSDQEVMAVQHQTYPLYGVQFHPESILTPQGKIILKNFMQCQAQSQKESIL